MSFKIGDTVRLKSQASDGPTMTVDELHGTHANCVWFDKNHVRHIDAFHVDTIIAWNDKPLMPFKG
jgi:uncharacterized protein YodC (DUF2158 family)